MANPSKHARLTEQELADAAGRSVRTIRRHEERGTIVRGKDGCFDRHESLRALAAAPAGGPAPKKLSTEADGEAPKRQKLIDWNERLKREQARKARLERLELQGKLVRRSAVEATWAEQATQVRDQLLQLGPRMADRLAAESDPRVCSRLVSDEVETALRALSGGG